MSAYLSEAVPSIEGAIHIMYISIGIDDAKELRGALGRATPGESIIVSCFDISRDAQDALLKIFEEPASGIDIYFIHPFPEALFETLQSRFIRIKNPKREPLNQQVEAFLAGDSKARGEIIKKLIADEASTSEILTLLVGIEQNLYKKGLEKNTASLRATLSAKERILCGFSVKLILPQLATVI